MKFGCQTILWGLAPPDMSRMLDFISDLGYQGVEFFQHPEVIASKLGNIDTVRKLCEERGLAVIGFAGGALEDRISYLGDWKEPYLYLDGWNVRAPNWMDDGYRLAVHPHYLKKIDSVLLADEVLRDYRQLLFIPDSAHAELKREDIVKSLSQYWNRLGAVHIKDWRPGFGRASMMYARGFTELGNGIVNIPRVLDFLQKKAYTGFVIVEQDYSEGVIEESARASVEWLTSLTQNYMTPKVFRLQPRPQRSPEHGTSRSDRLENEEDPSFPVSLQALACRDVGQLYHRLSEELLRHLGPGCVAVAIWSCSELDGLLSLQGLSPLDQPSQDLMTLLEIDTPPPLKSQWAAFSRSTSAVLRGALPVTANGRWRIPIRSSWNPNQTRLVLDLFAADAHDISLDSDHDPFLARAVRKAFDSQMDKIALSAAADLNESIVRSDDLEGLCGAIRDIIKKRLKCEGVVLFLADRSKTRLYPLPPEGVRWRAGVADGEKYYELNDRQLTTTIWRRGEPHFLNRGTDQNDPATQQPSKCRLEVVTPAQNRVLSMPVVDIARETIGLMRCANKIGHGGGICNFSDDDLVVLDGVLQQAIPAIRLRQSETYKSEELTEISHELKQPVSALRGVIFTMARELKGRRLRFGRNYLGDAEAWGDLLSAVVRQIDYTSSEIRPRFGKVALVLDVLAPTIRQLHWRLMESGLPSHRIEYVHSHMVPDLHADRNMLQQVFFNLLDNAIKYSKPGAPNSFRVRVIFSDEGTVFRIRIRDWGIGVPHEMKESVFSKGVRGPDNEIGTVFGTGLGLWLVKKLLAFHGATIAVTNLKEPTELTIDLPRVLEDGAPRKDTKRRQELQ